MDIKNTPLHRIAMLSTIAIIVSMVVLTGTVLFWILSCSSSKDSTTSYLMDMSIKTTEGIVEEVTLGDNSKVWVNSNSILKYATDYKVDRKVQLTGEAYFKVEKMDRTFTLSSDGVTLVMNNGTFLMESYPDKEYCHVFLYDGEAKLIKDGSTREIILNPGTDLLLYKDTQNMEMKRVKEGVYGPEWVNKQFDFTAFNSILYSLADYYDISVINQKPELNNEALTMTFEGNKTLEEVMFVLQTLCKKMNYRINGRELIIY